MCLAQGPQRSDAGEAQIHGPSISSQALYHWATALPTAHLWTFFIIIIIIIIMKPMISEKSNPSVFFSG